VMGTFVVDVSQFPVVLGRIDGLLTDAEMRELWDQLDVLLLGKRYGIVMDLRTATALPASQRAECAKRWRDNRKRAERACAVAALVISSELWRGVFTAVSWVVAPPHPVAFVANLSDGVECVRSALDEPRT
jgi:hypothetical protein